MSTLISSRETLSQIQNLANASSATLGRVTLSRTSSRNILPTELKCSPKSATKTLNIAAVRPNRGLERTRSEWQIELAPKSDKLKAQMAEDSGFVHEFCYLFMTTLEIFFFGPYDEVSDT